jgi:formate/nitrite transporter FocA (FNT family)
LTQLIGGLVFCLGLILVIVAGAELFTGNNLVVMACVSGGITMQLLRNWTIVYLGNFAACTIADLPKTTDQKHCNRLIHKETP